MTHVFDLHPALNENGEAYKASKTIDKYNRFVHVTSDENNKINLVSEHLRVFRIYYYDGTDHINSYLAWQIYGFSYFQLDEKLDIIKKEYLPLKKQSGIKYVTEITSNLDDSYLPQGNEGNNSSSTPEIKDCLLNEDKAKILFLNKYKTPRSYELQSFDFLGQEKVQLLKTYKSLNNNPPSIYLLNFNQAVVFYTYNNEFTLELIDI
jgi:hypothetical protein